MRQEARLRKWVAEGSWNQIAKYFDVHPPSKAGDFLIRAWMRGAQGEVPLRIVADLEAAHALSPGDPVILVNLAGALLATEQAPGALQAARAACFLAPDSLPALEKRAHAAVACAEWEEARECVQRALNVYGKHLPLPAWAAPIVEMLECRWWKPSGAGNYELRMPQESDIDFLAETFSNQIFMAHYHRFQAADSAAVREFVIRGKQPLWKLHRLDWIVVDLAGVPMGLAAIVDIDWRNRRGEMLIGFPGKVPQTAGLATSLAVMNFAFERLRLIKLVSLVYEDNLAAQANTLHLGFSSEGLLRDHIQTPDGRVGLFVNGLLHDEYRASPMLGKLRERWL